MKDKDKTDFDPNRMLWAVVVTNIILIVGFLAVIAAIAYFAGPSLLN